MKRNILLTMLTGIILISCSRKDQNPFFSEYDTPFGVPPFDLIEEKHYLPAYKEGIKQHQQEIEAIVNNNEAPTFENTVAALDYSGNLLEKASNVFNNMKSAHTSEQIQQIAKKVSPLLTQHKDDILLNKALFKRIKSIYDQRHQLQLNTEQMAVLEDYYRDFIRGGANLTDDKKAQLREINKELSLLTLKFGENVLKENNNFELLIDDKKDLSGLTEAAVASAAEAAAERGYEGKWVFTLHKPSLIPFLQYSKKRELREKMLKAYINRGNNDDEYDNKEILSRIVDLRVKRARLLGYDSHSHFILEDRMAKKPDNVYDLLNKLWRLALIRAKVESKELQDLIFEEGNNFKLQAWDWWYYAEKLKKARYDLDDQALRPYFEVEKVREGAFMVANKLWGITFEEITDLPLYHPDVKVFEVKEGDGSHIGILYSDYYPRESKRGGAWMNAYRDQYRYQEKEIKPIVTNVFNFTKPSADNPALLSLDEVETLYHEFGHALHGLFSKNTYKKLGGTNVAWDFVELPSQIMENWATEPEVLRMYAFHYQTGEKIPDELIEKIQQAGKFNQGFKTVEYLAASFLDMDWHTLTEPTKLVPIEFENKSMERIGMISEIVVRYRSPYFRHIFSGSYSSGYYSYIWAEVLDADAFQAFKNSDIFDPETAASFRNNILAKGGTEDPMVLYKQFRGREPKIDALLEKRGLN